MTQDTERWTIWACQGCGRIGYSAGDLLSQGCEGKPEEYVPASSLQEVEARLAEYEGKLQSGYSFCHPCDDCEAKKGNDRAYAFGFEAGQGSDSLRAALARWANLDLGTDPDSEWTQGFNAAQSDVRRFLNDHTAIDTALSNPKEEQ